MRTLLGWLGAALLGAIGWRLGALAGVWAAVIASAVGSGVGLYWGRRLFDDWLG